MLQRIYHQYNRYESALDDTLLGFESLSLGYLTHRILDPKIYLGTWRLLQMIWKTQHQIMNQSSPTFSSSTVICWHHSLI